MFTGSRLGKSERDPMARYEHLSREEMIRLLEARDRRDATRFGLVWEANEVERERALNRDFVALDLQPELCVGPGPWENLIIEGDNFDALRALRLAYAGRVQCIYIDPPYNTGNRDFVYNDRFVDREDLWRHSTWVEFMYQRLTLARDLLAPGGAIFVSIDDNEVFALGMLMHKVFGEGNFVANVVWQKRTSPDARVDLGPAHDYILVYAQSRSQLQLRKLALSPAQARNYKNPDNDPRGPWSSTDFTAQGFRPNQMYKLTTPSGAVYEPPAGRCWANLESVFMRLCAEGRMWFGKDGSTRPRVKTYLSEVSGISSWTWWPNDETGHNQEAKKEMVSILGGEAAFDTPKPVRLIERVLRIGCGPDDLVLDFFAGSGTTAHAVLKLNAEDGGRRRFILVSSTEATADQPDKNLCRDVCATRVRKVIEGYGDTPGLGGDFAYLRCRRLPTGSLIDIEHAEAWTALQLLHRGRIEPWRTAPFLWAGDEQDGLLYVPRFRREDLPALREQVRQSAAVVLYSWQPGVLRQLIPDTHVQHEAVPESLARHFRLGT
jgi:adenine-specific DNA-methyltransferase